jgi:hypothetical protein
MLGIYPERLQSNIVWFRLLRESCSLFGVLAELLKGVDESQIGGQVGLVGFQLWGEVCGEVSPRLWREWGGSL